MRAVPTRRIRRGLVALTSAVTLSALAACVGSGSARDPVDCSPYRKYGDLRGRIISVYSSIVGPEAGSQKDSYGAVGAGTFWKEMTNWVATNKSDKDVLDAIEQSWPKT